MDIDSQCITDDDGIGYYVIDGQKSNIVVNLDNLDPKYAQVVWYNK